MTRRLAGRYLIGEHLGAGGTATTSAGFEHPNAITVYDAGEDEDDLYIVMELVDGPSLAEHLSSSCPLAIGEATRIAHQVLSVRPAAHTAGIVHRDVKPASVLLKMLTGRTPFDAGSASATAMARQASAAPDVRAMRSGVPDHRSPSPLLTIRPPRSHP